MKIRRNNMHTQFCAADFGANIHPDFLALLIAFAVRDDLHHPLRRGGTPFLAILALGSFGGKILVTDDRP